MGICRPKAIEIFSGAGGMTLGFEQAGVEILGAFDIEQFNVTTHLANFPETSSCAVDLTKETGDSVRARCKAESIELDLLFGGPPCQGFSYGGRQNADDERNLLVYDFARLVRQLQPKYFVMENVKGFVSSRARRILESFLRRVKSAGYSVVDPIHVLNAADYGVPQRRKRVFIIGARIGLPLPAYPQPVASVASMAYPLVKDAIEDLPRLEGRDELFHSDDFVGTLDDPASHYAQIMRGLARDSNDHSNTRQVPGELLTGCFRTKHSKETVRRFKATRPGCAESVSRYIRLAWNDVSPTLRAGTGSDKGSHTAPRPIHPKLPRCITTREAARLHSFPDWFRFHGTRWHDFRQIGNAVPPLLARAVAHEIVRSLRGQTPRTRRR